MTINEDDLNSSGISPLLISTFRARRDDEPKLQQQQQQQQQQQHHHHQQQQQDPRLQQQHQQQQEQQHEPKLQQQQLALYQQVQTTEPLSPPESPKPTKSPESPKSLIKAPLESSQQPSKNYNLRKPKKRVLFTPDTKFSHKKPHTSFHNSKLSIINPKEYHRVTDDDQAKLVKLANKFTSRAQLDRFVCDSKSYIVMSWLTTARIFEYDQDDGVYTEVKRIPERFVQLAPNLITSIHYSDSKFYLAHLWGNPNTDTEKKTKSYIEIKNIYGQQLANSIYYDDIVTSIYSDSDYIYVKHIDNTINLHLKVLFNCVFHHIDLRNFTNNPLIQTYVAETILNGPCKKLKLLSATTEEILVSHYDCLIHKLVQCYKFGDNFKTVSINKLSNLFIIHRNSDSESKIDFGFLGRAQPDQEDTFIHAAAIHFTNHIKHVKVQGEKLIVLGYTSKRLYQVGCFYLPSLKPIWTKTIDSGESCPNLLPHDDHVVIIKDCQEISCISTKKTIGECPKCKIGFLHVRDQTRHGQGQETILSKISITKNRYLEDVGTSIFKKSEEYEGALQVDCC